MLIKEEIIALEYRFKYILNIYTHICLSFETEHSTTLHVLTDTSGSTPAVALFVDSEENILCCNHSTCIPTDLSNQQEKPLREIPSSVA